MLKAIPIALCIYSGIIEAGYEKRAVDQTLVGKIPVVNPKKPIHHFGSGSVTNPVPLVQTTPNYPKDALDKKLTGKVEGDHPQGRFRFDHSGSPISRRRRELNQSRHERSHSKLEVQARDAQR